MATSTVSDQESKTARLSFRSTPEQKSLLERAAAVLGVNVTSFVLSTALRDAAQVVQQHQLTQLSMRDWAAFETLVTSDTPPSPLLQDALKAYKTEIAHSDGL